MIFKSDKLDYLRCPRKEIFFDNFFSIEQGPSNVGKLNWDLLGFFFHSYSVSPGVSQDPGCFRKEARGDFNIDGTKYF